MNRSAAIFSITITLLICSIGVSPSAANLILNPGFELDASGDAPTNWDVVRADVVKSVDLGITPHSGSRQFQFQNNGSMLSQTFTSSSIANYELSMWIASRSPSNNLVMSEVTFDMLDDEFNVIDPVTKVSNDFSISYGVYVQWTRTYESLGPGTYTIRVSTGDGVGANQGMVDDFSLVVTAVPEPSTYAMAAGLGAFLLALRRRR